MKSSTRSVMVSYLSGTKLTQKKNHCIMKKKIHQTKQAVLNKPLNFNFSPSFKVDVKEFLSGAKKLKTSEENTKNGTEDMEVDSMTTLEKSKMSNVCLLSKAVMNGSLETVRTSIETMRDKGTLNNEDLNYALLLAVGQGFTCKTRLLLENGANPKKYDEFHPILKSAVIFNHEELVDILLERGCDPNSTGPDETVLHSAVRIGNINIIKKLIGAGSDIEAKTKTQGATPLHLAVVHNKLEVVMHLLSLNCQKDVPDTAHNRTPMHWAALYGRTYMTEAFVNNGHSVWTLDKNGNFPWSLGLLNNHTGVVRLLIDTIDVNQKICMPKSRLLRTNDGDADDDDENESDASELEEPLMVVACSRGSREAVKILLQKGADLTTRNHNGDTCLISAVRARRFQIVQFLCKQEQIKNIINERDAKGKDALQLLLESSVKPSSLIKCFVEAGANVNQVLSSGNTLAIDNASEVQILNQLAENGANINFVCENGNTVLHEAVKADISSGQVKCTKFVLGQSNVDLSLSRIQYGGLTPLHSALEARHSELVQLLVQAGCSFSTMRSWLESDTGKALVADVTMKDVISQVQHRLKYPQSLLDISRCSVNKSLGHKDLRGKMDQLELPTILKNYLSLNCYLKWKKFDEPLVMDS